jgi:hypothetical protein
MLGKDISEATSGIANEFSDMFFRVIQFSKIGNRASYPPNKRGRTSCGGSVKSRPPLPILKNNQTVSAFAEF